MLSEFALVSRTKKPKQKFDFVLSKDTDLHVLEFENDDKIESQIHSLQPEGLGKNLYPLHSHVLQANGIFHVFFQINKLFGVCWRLL